MKTNYLNSFVIVFLLCCLFSACNNDDNNEIVPKERSYAAYTIQDSAFVMYKSLQGTTDGGVESNNTTYFYEWGLSSKRMHDAVKNSSYMFINDTDSVHINGIIYLRSEKQIYQWTIADKVFKYKFENDQFKIFFDDVIRNISGIGNYIDWLTIGYGSKEKFSVFLESKVIFGTQNGSIYAQSMQFIDPSSIRESGKYGWTEFFNESATWDYYNFESIEKLTENYRAFWSIFRYDFVMEEAK